MYGYGKTRAEEPSNVGYVAFSILAIFYVIMSGGWAVVAFNWKFKYAFDEPPDAPNGLVSDTGDKVYWAVFIISLVRIAALCAVVARSANSKKRFLEYLLYPVALVALCGEIAACVIFFLAARGCNNAPGDDPSGLNARFCNDFSWCCVYGDVFDVTAADATCPATSVVCPPSGMNVLTPCSASSSQPCPPLDTTVTTYCPVRFQPCLPTVNAGDLTPNWVFSSTLGSTFVFMILDVLVIFVSIWMKDGVDSEYYYVNTSVNSRYEQEEGEGATTKTVHYSKKNVD